MGWFERKMRQRRERRQLLFFRRLLGERTAEQIAENLRTSDLAERIPTGDATKLTRDIDGLDERDRYLLARWAEGESERDSASALWFDQQTVKQHLARIVKRLRGEGGANS
jgi:DNA-binding NarL/FixJ family response regulator